MVDSAVGPVGGCHGDELSVHYMQKAAASQPG